MAGTGQREYIVLPVPNTTNRTTRVLVATPWENRYPDSQIGLIVDAKLRGDTYSNTPVP